jgi:hypothetical protein
MPLIQTRNVRKIFHFIVHNPRLKFMDGDPMIVSFKPKKVEFLPDQFTMIDKWGYIIVEDSKDFNVLKNKYSLQGICQLTTPITEPEFEKFCKDLIGVSVSDNTTFLSFSGLCLNLSLPDKPHTLPKYSSNFHDTEPESELVTARNINVNEKFVTSNQSTPSRITMTHSTKNFKDHALVEIKFTFGERGEQESEEKSERDSDSPEPKPKHQHKSTKRERQHQDTKLTSKKTKGRY